MILIVDFGSQTCHLISRRLRDLGAEVVICDPEKVLEEIRQHHPEGIILSGGPSSVYEKDASTVDKRIFQLGIPILGICYGWQVTAQLLGGKVISGHKEYGPANLKVQIQEPLFSGFESYTRVWLSHGDTVIKLPFGFEVLGATESVKIAAVADFKRKIFGVQFHPEVEHTSGGKEILKNFAQKVCSLRLKKKKILIKKIIESIKKEIGCEDVVCAVSGGVDSTVSATLIGKAIGKQLHPIYVESGLMRLGTKERVQSIFRKFLKIPPIIVDAQKLFLKRLKGVTDPEEKRKIIGKLYIEIFEKEAKKIPRVTFLAQGTIYSDVIESKGTSRSAKIKSHHNVGGLPEKMNLKLLEPLRYFYKDEVRFIGEKLGLSEEIIYEQPFPGPGQAIRIIGEVTKERLEKQQQADQIVLTEIKKSGWYRQVFQSFPVLTGIRSTAVKGDARVYGEVVGLRVYGSSDVMTAGWSKLPYDVLQEISSRIVNEVPDVSRVVYDITTKPPATMEWE